MATSAVFTIAVDPALLPAGDVQRVMEALEDADLSPILQEFGQIMDSYETENFLTQGGAFTPSWADIAPSTVAEKKRLGYSAQPLVRTGNLADHLGQTVSVGPNGVMTGVDLNAVPYAAYLHGGTRRMPARILVSLSDDEVQAMEDALNAWVSEMVPGAGSAVSIREAVT